nr:E3 ubiquitin-protein ligase Hakai-like [Penaeus vannamei]
MAVSSCTFGEILSLAIHEDLPLIPPFITADRRSGDEPPAPSLQPPFTSPCLPPSSILSPPAALTFVCLHPLVTKSRYHLLSPSSPIPPQTPHTNDHSTTAHHYTTATTITTTSITTIAPPAPLPTTSTITPYTTLPDQHHHTPANPPHTNQQQASTPAPPPQEPLPHHHLHQPHQHTPSAIITTATDQVPITTTPPQPNYRHPAPYAMYII